MNVLAAVQVSVHYPGSLRPALRDVSAAIPRGSFTAIIGPNGSGKSTLIRVLLGALRPDHGRALFEDRDVASYRRADLARHIGAVTQIEEMPFPITVRELVSTGRYVHLGAWRAETAHDRTAVHHALERCDITGLAERSINRISGGERQRARIARALAQEPSTLVLDEPTASLDIGHEMAVFQLLRSLTRAGVTVLVATHHINLAARFADQLILLHEGSVATQGAVRQVMTRPTLEQVYGWPLHLFPHPGAGDDQGAPQIAPVSQTPSTNHTL